MKCIVPAALLAIVSACSAVAGSRPDLGASAVVSLAHQPAQQVAAKVCGILHGVAREEVERSGCSVEGHGAGHDGDDAHVSLIPDPRSNSIVLAAPPGREVQLARAVALVRELDQPAVAAR